MIRRPLRLAILVLLLVLTAFGSALADGGLPPRTEAVTPAGTPTLAGVTCDWEHNWAIECKNPALLSDAGNPAAKINGNPTAGFAPIQGTDTYGGAANVASNPDTHFNLSYLSDSYGKDWTTGDLYEWHRYGKPTGFVWEQGAAQAENGCYQGEQDAYHALAEANSLGAPYYSVIHAAVDTGTSGYAVKSYFECWEHVLGPERAGDYGSYDVVRDLNQWGIITTRGTWQTRAWSGGMLYSGACLYQWAIPPMGGTNLNGTGVDRDVQLKPDCGLFPYAAPAPVDPEHYVWLPDTLRTFHVHGHTIRARERVTVEMFDHTGCVLDPRTHRFQRQTCRILAVQLRLLSGRIYAIAHWHELHHRPRWDATHFSVKGHTTTLGGGYQQEVRRLYATKPIKSWN